MRASGLRLGTLQQRRWFNCSSRRLSRSLPIINIDNATFYRQYPSAKADDSTASSTNPPIFPNLTFSLPANGTSAAHNEYWSIVSSSSLARTTFLQVLNGQFICVPPNARSHPYLASVSITDTRSHSPSNAIKYVGFDAERGGIGGTSLKGAYLSARYESRKEETDFSVRDYLTGNTELNALDTTGKNVDLTLLNKIVLDLKLAPLLDMPVGNLSNGQTRRARIAKSLMSRPEVLLLDGPFMGLDPPTVSMLSSVLRDLAERSAPRLVLSLRPEDHVPVWISHLVLVDESLKVLGKGPKADVLSLMTQQGQQRSLPDSSMATSADKTSLAREDDEPLSRDGFPKHDPAPTSIGEAIVEMTGARVTYNGNKTVLGAWTQPAPISSVPTSSSSSPTTSPNPAPGLHWTVHRGQRWGIFGPNGSGKTTLLSLITSDHPQTYSLPITLFGRSRLPSPGQLGISIFELQRRIGHSSPEVHAYFPKHLSVRRVLESAWADAPLSRPQLDSLATRRVDACLRWFAHELKPSQHQHQVESAGANVANVDIEWARTLPFRDLDFSAQRLALFLRAIVANQELVILDEAFSGMDEATRDKALLFLSWGETKRLGAGDGPGDASTSAGASADADADAQVAVAVRGLSSNQALLVISHSKQDVPGCVRQWVCLPEPGEGRAPRWGALDGPLELNAEGWDDIWGMRGHGVENK